MHVPRCIVVALAGASLAVGFAGAAAGVEEAPVGYERFDVKPAGLSILVPDGMRIAKPSGDVLFSAFDGGKYVEHAVTVIRSNRYTSLPSLAAVRSNGRACVAWGPQCGSGARASPTSRPSRRP